MFVDKKNFAESFLKRIREFIKSKKLSFERLPKWMEFSDIKIAKINNSNIFVIEDSYKKEDTFQDYGSFNCDLQFLLNLPDYHPKGAHIRAPKPQSKSTKLIIWINDFTDEGKVTFELKSAGDLAFTDLGLIGYHSPFMIINIILKLVIGMDIIAIRWLPCILYCHDYDIHDFEIFWYKCTPHIQNTILGIHNSKDGDYYEILKKEDKHHLLVSKEKSVIIYGSYDQPFFNELLYIRDYLISKNYDARLLKELPELPSWSLEQKVRFWSSPSRFCIVVDRVASGHLTEYNFIKNERVILALLREKGKRSTYMIGDERIDYNYINVFEFEKSPLNILDEVIEWAEKKNINRIEQYKKEYPWRK